MTDTNDKKVDEAVEETATETVAETATEEVAKAEAPVEDAGEDPADDGASVEVPAKFKKLVDEVESMSVLELHELVKVLEKKFGVSAAAMAVAGPGAGAGEAAEEKTSFTVELKSSGETKIAVIKAVKAALGLGLKEAKDLVDGVPSVLKDNVAKAEAEAMKKDIEAAGGTVELK